MCTLDQTTLRQRVGVLCPRFTASMRDHLRRQAMAYVLLLLAALLFQLQFALGVNVTGSLPQTLFLIHKGEPATRDQYVAFRWLGGGPYPAGVTFIKRIAGIPGDSITCEGRQFRVNGSPVGGAKRVSRMGLPLALGPTGVLPPGHYYVQASHPDSLDSRYALTGWVGDAQIIGRAYALF